MAELVHFVLEEQIRDQVRLQWEHNASLLRALLPGATIEHVGSTAVPGSLTKGDLDIQVRVPAQEFAAAESLLARHYQRNLLSTRHQGFAASEDRNTVPPVGVQLTTVNGDLDIFWRIREVLLKRPDLRKTYDDIKRSFEGKEMTMYRQAKDHFLEALRLTPEYNETKSS